MFYKLQPPACNYHIVLPCGSCNRVLRMDIATSIMSVVLVQENIVCVSLIMQSVTMDSFGDGCLGLSLKASVTKVAYTLRNLLIAQREICFPQSLKYLVIRIQLVLKLLVFLWWSYLCPSLGCCGPANLILLICALC